MTVARQRLNRAAQGAFDAAAGVFRSAGWEVELEFGGKHALILAWSGAHTARLPLCGTPRGGDTAGALMAERNARRIVRQAEAAALTGSAS